MGVDQAVQPLGAGVVERSAQDLVAGPARRELRHQQVLEPVRPVHPRHETVGRPRLAGCQHVGVLLLVGVVTVGHDPEVDVGQVTRLDHRLGLLAGERVASRAPASLDGARGMEPGPVAVAVDGVAEPPLHVCRGGGAGRDDLDGERPPQVAMGLPAGVGEQLSLLGQAGLQPADGGSLGADEP